MPLATLAGAVPWLLGGAALLAGAVLLAVRLVRIASRSGPVAGTLLRLTALAVVLPALYYGGLCLLLGIATIGCGPGDYECPV